MKIKDGFMLREVAGTWIVIPLGQRTVEFNGLMTLSESGALIWKALEGGTEIYDLVSLILQEYNIDEITARNDVVEIIEAIKQRGLMVECLP